MSSDLEREFELEREDSDYSNRETGEEEFELEREDLEMEDSDYSNRETGEEEFELEREDLEMEDSDYSNRETGEEEFELEMEDSDYSNREVDNKVDELAQKFFELSQQSFESEIELDNRINSLLRESEFFLWDKLKKIGKPLLKNIAKTAWSTYGNMPLFKALKASTGPLRTAFKGPMGAMVKSILTNVASAHPGSAAALTALKSLGLSEIPENNYNLWKNYVGLMKEAYEQLAENYDERSATNPIVANRLVSHSIESAISKRRKRISGRGGSRRHFRARPGQTLRITDARPGQTLIIHLSKAYT